jgi:hypothetical protein
VKNYKVKIYLSDFSFTITATLSTEGISQLLDAIYSNRTSKWRKKTTFTVTSSGSDPSFSFPLANVCLIEFSEVVEGEK